MAVRRVIDIVRFENVSARYPQFPGMSSRNPIILEKLNFSLSLGGFYFLTGPSGSGKTSLLKLMYRDLEATEGQIYAFGKNITHAHENELPRIRQKMGLLFQDCRLAKHLTILDNILLPLKITDSENAHSNRNAAELLDWVGLADKLKHYPDQLSDGEKQRVALVRAIISHPFIILADEPTGNLDDPSAVKLLHLLEELNKNGTTIVVATHNQALLDLKGSFHHLQLQNGHLHTSEGNNYARVS